MANPMLRFLARLWTQVAGARRGGPAAPASPSPPATSLASEQLPGLTWDPDLGWYATRARWGDAAVVVRVSAETEPEAATALETAHQLWGSQTYWARAAADRVVADLLELKNESWVDEEDDTPLTPDQFLRRLSLASIVTYPDGSFEFFFDDGDTFFGHTVIVSGSLAEGAEFATIAG